MVRACLIKSFFKAVCKIRLRDSRLGNPENPLPQKPYDELINRVSSPRRGPNVGRMRTLRPGQMEWMAVRIKGKDVVAGNDSNCQISGSDESDKDLKIP